MLFKKGKVLESKLLLQRASVKLEGLYITMRFILSQKKLNLFSEKHSSAELCVWGIAIQRQLVQCEKLQHWGFFLGGFAQRIFIYRSLKSLYWSLKSLFRSLKSFWAIWLLRLSIQICLVAPLLCLVLFLNG